MAGPAAWGLSVREQRGEGEAVTVLRPRAWRALAGTSEQPVCEVEQPDAAFKARPEAAAGSHLGASVSERAAGPPSAAVQGDAAFRQGLKREALRL